MKRLLLLVFACSCISMTLMGQPYYPASFNFKKSYGCSGVSRSDFMPLSDTTFSSKTIHWNEICGYTQGDNDWSIDKGIVTISGAVDEAVFYIGTMSEYGNSDPNMTLVVESGNVYPAFDSMFANDSTYFELVCPPLNPDTPCYSIPDINQIAKTYDFALDEQDNYHIIASAYLPNDNFRNDCGYQEFKVVYIKTNSVPNSDTPIEEIYGRLPSSFLEYIVIDSIVENAYDFRIADLPGQRLGFVMLKPDSIVTLKTDATLHTISRMSYSYPYAGTDYPASFDNFNFVNGSYYLFYKRPSLTTEPFDKSYMRFDTALVLVEQKENFLPYEYDNLTGSFAGKNVFYFPYNDSVTVAKFINANRDTIKTILLPYACQKTMFTPRGMFVTLDLVKDVDNSYVTHYLNFYDSTGGFLNRMRLPFGSEDSLYFPQTGVRDAVSDFFIDKFNNLHVLLTTNEGSGCPHGSASYWNYLQLHINLDGFILSALPGQNVKMQSTLYPNPFSQTATLRFNYGSHTVLSVLSLEGKLLQQYASASNSHIIQREGLNSGMYLYELRDKENNRILDSGKLVVQ